MTRISLTNVLVVFIVMLGGCFYTVNSAAVMSVDLGSEWMKIGVVSPGVPMEIVLNKESKRKTPAVIAFRDGVRTFGEDAQSIGVRFPANAYYYLLDLLGKNIDNPIVELYRKRFPYYEIIADEHRNTVSFKNGEDIYSVEELIAQLLVKAKEFTEINTGQPITECVLIVPGFFGQAERLALLTAAQLANLKVLQLINDYTAVALNYGVFRRMEINETAQYFLFYDMGAQKTSAAVVSYQLIKDRATRETNPVIQVLGVGYDRTLGGLEIQLRLRDYLAREFNKLGKTKTDVTKNPRAMAKLFKEAGRVKNVLSANADHYAQIENLIEDHDYKLQVTREQLQDLCNDLWERVGKPLEQALRMSGLTLDVINQVILFGGGTRVPKVQEILRDLIKQELGKNLNADEAAAIGAVYKAADLATGFKVKKFIVRDAVVFPIQVVFERDTGEGGAVKQVRRTLFGQMNSYPQKKVITFNKHTQDFHFYVNYAELTHLNNDEITYIGNFNLSHVELSKVANILNQHSGENVESKGIKAHFALDDSGIFELTGIDFVFEKQRVGADDAADDESTLSKLGNTISKLFSGDSSKTGEEKKESVEEAQETNQTSSETESDQSNKTESTNDTTQTSSTSEKSAKNQTVKVITIKEPVQHQVTYLYATPLAGANYDRALDKLNHLNDLDRERSRRESALNALESFVIEAQHRLNSEEYSSCASDSEIANILAECSSVSEWLYDDGEHADAVTYEKRLKQLKKLTNDVYARHWEHEERPEALKALNGMIDGAQKFLESAKNLTKDANPDKDVFTKVEIDVLQRTIDETIEWKKTEVNAQNTLKRNEPVRMTVKDLTDKMALLDREVKYLVNKIKLWKPKRSATQDKATGNNKTKDGEVPSTGNDTIPTTDDENVEVLDEDEDQIEKAPNSEGDDVELKDDDNNQESDTLKTGNEKKTGDDVEAQTPHGEL